MDPTDMSEPRDEWAYMNQRRKTPGRAGPPLQWMMEMKQMSHFPRGLCGRRKLIEFRSWRNWEELGN
jgi:hypothetical protein